jgi:D-alanyl-D-alanine carboxypeptidase/D-alanyl-D-alanine-endopeptidase (penicillin-binding protein 4)
LAAAAVLAVALLAAQGSASGGGPPVRPLAGPDVAARTPIAKSAAFTSRRPLRGAALRRKLDRLSDSTGGASGAWVYDVGAKRRVFADEGNRRRILASNMKLFTTATALEVIGPRDQLETEVWTDGSIDGGVLEGDLYLVGDGDPALSSKGFAAANGLPLTPFGHLSKQIKQAGVQRVTGRIYADDSVFDRVRGVPDSGGATSPYIGPLSGLSYNSGSAAGGGFASDPALVAGQALKDDLRRRGVEIGGEVRLGEAPSEAMAGEPLASVPSPSIAALIEETNHVSNNFFAEMLLKRVGAAGGNTGTTRRGAGRVEGFAESIGARVHAVDGSGLTRSNTAAPSDVGALLLGMLEHAAAEEFFNSLPIAGQEGTVAYRMRGTAAAGFCRAKTGTLSDVSALSGYCGAGKSAIVFSILNNSVSPSSARSVQDQMVALIARYAG